IELGDIGASVNALFRTRAGAGGNRSIQLFDEEGNPIQDDGEGIWLRVTRVEPVDVFFSEYSPDGQNWFIADSRVFDWPSDSAAFGLAAGSGANDQTLEYIEVTSLEFVSTPPVAIRELSQQIYKGGDTIAVTIRGYVSGTDRSAMTITETPPSGWEISNVSTDGTVNNGSIHWSLTDLPVGETVFTYQVTVPAAPDNFAIWEGNVEESVNILGPTTLPLLDITGGDRVSDGIVVLYTFLEGEGNVVHDVS